MTEKVSILLENEQQGHAALLSIWKLAKAHLSAQRRMLLTLAPETRSDSENRLLHAMLGYISKNMEWAGQKRDIDTWKRLMTAAWCRATNEHVEILPAVDGHGVDIVFKRTSTLTRAECADLITFIYAWGAMNDVNFPAQQVKIDEPAKLLE